MKTSIIGLLMYGCFLLHLAVRAISPKSWKALPEAKMQRKVLLACAAALAVNTLTTGGLGFPATYLGVVLLIGICYAPVWGHQKQPESDLTSANALRVPRQVRTQG
jgi:hypothetical protein